VQLCDQCPSCGGPVDAQDAFCRLCGLPVAEAVAIIELEDTGEAGPARGHAALVEPGDPDPAPQPPGTGRSGRGVRRWLVLGVGILIAVWATAAFGLGGDDDAAAPTPGTGEQAGAEPSGASALVAESDSGLSADPPAGAGAVAEGLQLIVATRGGAELVDVAEGGRTTVVPIGSLGTATPVGMAGRWLVARDGDDTLALALDSGTRVELAPSQDLIVWSSRSTTVWRVSEPDERYDHVRAQLMDLNGDDPQLTLRLPAVAKVVGATGSGVVAETPGGIFFVDRAGARELVAGVVRGVAGGAVYYWGCDDDFACGTGIVEIATGDIRPAEFDLGPAPRLAVVTFAPADQAISYYAFSNSGPLTFEVVDIERADRTVIYEPLVSTFPTAWSDDGRFFLYTVDGVLAVHDRMSRTTTRTEIEIPVGNNVGLYLLAGSVSPLPTD
jgi:hypothetical protein